MLVEDYNTHLAVVAVITVVSAVVLGVVALPWHPLLARVVQHVRPKSVSFDQWPLAHAVAVGTAAAACIVSELGERE